MPLLCDIALDIRNYYISYSVICKFINSINLAKRVMTFVDLNWRLLNLSKRCKWITAFQFLCFSKLKFVAIPLQFFRSWTSYKFRYNDIAHQGFIAMGEHKPSSAQNATEEQASTGQNAVSDKPAGLGG